MDEYCVKFKKADVNKKDNVNICRIKRESKELLTEVKDKKMDRKILPPITRTTPKLAAKSFNTKIPQLPKIKVLPKEIPKIKCVDSSDKKIILPLIGNLAMSCGDIGNNNSGQNEAPGYMSGRRDMPRGNQNSSFHRKDKDKQDDQDKLLDKLKTFEMLEMKLLARNDRLESFRQIFYQGHSVILNAEDSAKDSAEGWQPDPAPIGGSGNTFGNAFYRERGFRDMSYMNSSLPQVGLQYDRGADDEYTPVKPKTQSRYNSEWNNDWDDGGSSAPGLQYDRGADDEYTPVKPKTQSRYNFEWNDDWDDGGSSAPGKNWNKALNKRKIFSCTSIASWEVDEEINHMKAQLAKECESTQENAIEVKRQDMSHIFEEAFEIESKAKVVLEQSKSGLSIINNIMKKNQELEKSLLLEKEKNDYYNCKINAMKKKIQAQSETIVSLKLQVKEKEEHIENNSSIVHELKQKLIISSDILSHAIDNLKFIESRKPLHRVNIRAEEFLAYGQTQEKVNDEKQHDEHNEHDNTEE